MRRDVEKLARAGGAIYESMGSTGSSEKTGDEVPVKCEMPRGV